jgi:hypothetical protein
MRFDTEDGGHVVVEVDDDEPGVQRASRQSGTIVDARRRFEDALGDVRGAAVAALRTFRDDRLGPDGIEIEFGIRLNAEAGAVIAKTTVEGHLVVKLTWTRRSGEEPTA